MNVNSDFLETVERKQLRWYVVWAPTTYGKEAMAQEGLEMDAEKKGKTFEKLDGRHPTSNDLGKMYEYRESWLLSAYLQRQKSVHIYHLKRTLVIFQLKSSVCTTKVSSTSSEEDVVLVENIFLKDATKEAPVNWDRKINGEYHHLFFSLKQLEKRLFWVHGMTFEAFTYFLEKIAISGI